MEVAVQNPSKGGGHSLNVRCPICRQHGTFHRILDVTDVSVTDHWLGHRKCPNTDCAAHIFFVCSDYWKVLRTYPALCIDFDSSNVPPKVAESLSQAITCHAEECYIASAIMVRRCLEDLCEDRGATGSNLKERLNDLSGKIVVPKELAEALDELRLLGNDAAHVEAKTFSKIGKDELDVSIEVTKEILKAVYQMDSLVKRLQALKKNP